MYVCCIHYQHCTNAEDRSLRFSVVPVESLPYSQEFVRRTAARHDTSLTGWANKTGQTFRPGLSAGGAAGNRTRVLRHSLKTSPCAVRCVSTWISQSREQAEMTIPVAVWCPDTSRDRMYRFIPLADARVRAEGAPGLTDTPSLLRQRGRSRADWNRRLIGCIDAYGGLLPAPARFP